MYDVKSLTDKELAIHQKKAKKISFTKSYFYDTHMPDPDGGGPIKKPGAPTEDEWKEQVVQEIMAYKKSVKMLVVAYIFHDKDVEMDGSRKPLHVHVFFWFKDNGRVSTVAKRFDIPRIKNIQTVNSHSGTLRYFLHITSRAIQDEKHIYGTSELFYENIDGNDKYDFKKLLKSNFKEDTTDLVDELDDMAVSLHTSIRKHGLKVKEAEKRLFDYVEDSIDEEMAAAERIYQKHRSAFIKDREEYLDGKEEEVKKEGRNLTNIYIQGQGGIGKTRIGRKYALSKTGDDVYHAASSPSKGKTFDMASTYKGELVTVLDEVTSDNFYMGEFLNLFDSGNYSPAGSRNIDKVWLAEMAVFTNSETLTDFAYSLVRYTPGSSGKYFIGENMTDKGKDKFFQILRRFRYELNVRQLEDGTKRVHIMKFNKELKGFQYLGYEDAQSDFHDYDYLSEELVERIDKRMEADVIDPKFSDGVLGSPFLIQDEKVKKYTKVDWGIDVCEDEISIPNPDNPFEN